MFISRTTEQYNKQTNEGKNDEIHKLYLQNTTLQLPYTTTKFRNKNRSPRIKRRKQYFNSKIEGESKTMSFENHLLEAIDEGLSILGESGRQAIYYRLEKNFKIKKQKIPYKIEEFTDAIERIFGDGTKILEIRIMKFLFKKVRYAFKEYPKLESLTFMEYIEVTKLAMNNFGKRKKMPQNTNNLQKQENKILCIKTH